jgi:hypothetical protein
LLDAVLPNYGAVIEIIGCSADELWLINLWPNRGDVGGGVASTRSDPADKKQEVCK